MKIVKGIIACGMACAYAGLLIATESKTAVMDVESPYERAEIALSTRYNKPLVKDYAAMREKLEQGEIIEIASVLFDVFGKKVNDIVLHPTWGYRGSKKDTLKFKARVRGVERTFSQTPYYSAGRKIYKAIQKGMPSLIAIKICGSKGYFMYELDSCIDFIHLAVLSNLTPGVKNRNYPKNPYDFPTRRMTVLRQIPFANIYLCHWPRYRDEATGKVYTVIANDSDGPYLCGHARDERTCFSSIPWYLQKKALENYPFLRTSDHLQWASVDSLFPNVKRRLRALVRHVRYTRLAGAGVSTATSSSAPVTAAL